MLSNLTRKGVEWLPEHDEAFCNIKRLTKTYPVCKPINYDSSEPVTLVADASNRGLGGYFGQGKDYKTMIPAGFHSRAFNPAEKKYPTHDKEMLAIIDCLKKFEPRLSYGSPSFDCPHVRFAGTRHFHDSILKSTTFPGLPIQRLTHYLATHMSSLKKASWK